MEDIKTCTQCNQSMSIVNFQKYKTPRKDGTTRYGTWCVLCKANYNNDYMKRRREDPVFREKEKAYHETHKRNAPTITQCNVPGYVLRACSAAPNGAIFKIESS